MRHIYRMVSAGSVDMPLDSRGGGNMNNQRI